MIRKANTSTSNPQGGEASRVAGLYQTGHGILSGARIRTLWNGGAPADAGSQPASEGQGQGQQQTQSQQSAQQPQGQGQRQQGPSDIERLTTALQGLVNQPRHGGDPFQAALTLMGENYGYRDRIRELEGTTTQQAEQLTAYRALGEDPAQLGERLRRGEEALYLQEVSDLAARVDANPRVLARELRNNQLEAYVRDMPAGGGHPARQEVHVRDKDGNELGELRSYVREHLGDYEAAIFPQGGGQSRSGSPAPRPVVPVIGQHGGGTPTAPAASFVQERINQRRQAATGENA